MYGYGAGAGTGGVDDSSARGEGGVAAGESGLFRLALWRSATSRHVSFRLRAARSWRRRCGRALFLVPGWVGEDGLRAQRSRPLSHHQ
jgi:hypothetical protein